MNQIFTTVSEWTQNRVCDSMLAKDMLMENKFGRAGFKILQVADFENGTVQTIKNIANTFKNIGLAVAVLCFILAGIGIMFGGQLQQKAKGLLIGGVIGIIILVLATAIRDWVKSKATE